MKRGIFCLLLLLLGIALTTQVYAITLYGTTTNGSSAESNFYTINPATGAATLIGSTGFNGVSAMDVHPTTNVMYAIGKARTGVNAGLNVLFTINPATGVGTEIGKLGRENGFADMSFRADGSLFAVNGLSNFLYSINITTGLATSVGSHGSFPSGGGMGFNAGGTLYFARSGSSFYTMNPATAALTALPNLTGFPGTTDRLSAVDFHPVSDIMYAIAYVNSSVGNGPDYLVTVNTSTSVITSIGATTSGMDALAFRPDDQILPVELASFNLAANGVNVQVRWRTASEHDNAGFEVQRKWVGVDQDFKTIGSYISDPTLAGLGTSSQGKNYSFTDGDVLHAGESYQYRLVDITTDGIRTEHPGMTVRIESGSVVEDYHVTRLYPATPNPAQNIVQISFSLKSNEQVRVEFYSADAKLVATPLSGMFEAGEHAETVSVEMLPPGVYTIILTSGNHTGTQRVVVLR